MSPKKAAYGFMFLMILSLTATAWAVSSSLWEVDSAEDFEAGESDGVMILSPGGVVLGPRADVTDIDALYTWRLADDAKGRIYAGTGNDGKIFRVSRNGSVEIFAELELQQVFALVVDGDGMLYAAGFPGGKVLAINSAGEVSEYFDTGEDSVWALCPGPGNVLFVAAGEEGKIFRVEAREKGALFYDSSERRILSLLCNTEGTLYAGSEQNGLVYRFDRTGNAFVLYDTELEEVVSMAMGADGALYAVSSPGDLFVKLPPIVPPAIPKSGASPAAAATAAATFPQEQAAPAMPAIPSPKKRTSIIYRIQQDGTGSKFWTSPEKLVFSIAFDGDDILAATGDDGEIYRVTPEKEGGMYYKSDQKQVLHLHRLRDGSIAAALGNEAGVVMFREGFRSEGTLVSLVHDAGSPSRWGRALWEANRPQQTSISISTRSGNSEKPDDTWSGWSREHRESEGFPIESPPARYIQWRADLGTSNAGTTPMLAKVTVGYLEGNLAPEVESITVGSNDDNQNKGSAGAHLAQALKNMKAGAAGTAPSNSGDAPKSSRQGVKPAPEKHETRVAIRWEASDANSDKLEYELYFKGTDESRWKLLEDELEEATFELDTEAVPDGEYHVKVKVSDSPDNPGPTALVSERVSDVFVVDNTPPSVEGLRATRIRNSKQYRITGDIRDKRGPLRSAYYSIDAGDWVALFPLDGIFDSPSERMDFTTETLEAGEHTLVVKVSDYFGNVGAGKTTFDVK